MATPKKKITYSQALKKNKSFAQTQLRREAKQGKKGAPSQAAIERAYKTGKDSLTAAQLNAMYDKFSPPPKAPKKKTVAKKTTSTKKKK